MTVFLTVATIIGFMAIVVSEYRHTMVLRHLYCVKTDAYFRPRQTVTVNQAQIATILTKKTGRKHYVSGRKIGDLDHWYTTSHALDLATSLA